MAAAAPLSRIERLLGLWRMLSASNRILLGVVAAGVVMVSGWLMLGGEARGVAKVPLLPGHQFTDAEKHAALKAFGGTLQDYEIQDRVILVPANRRARYLQQMASSTEGLPKTVFQSLRDSFRDRTWYESQADGDRRFHIEFLDSVSRALVKLNPNIEEAIVLSAPAQRQGLRRTNEAKASVTLALKEGTSLSPTELAAVKRMVAGSLLHVTEDRVVVFGGGGVAGDTGFENPDDQRLNAKLAYDRYYAEQISRLFRKLPGVEVVVNTVVDERQIAERVENKYSKGAVKQEDSTSKSSESTAPSPGGEPGVRPNVDAANVASNQAARAGSTNNTTDEGGKKEFNNDVVQLRERYPGYVDRSIGVVVTVPRSYMEAPPAAGTAPPAGAAAAATPELSETKIKQMILALNLPGLTPTPENENKITVRTTDVPIPAPPTEPPFDFMAFLRQYVGTIVLVVLALAAIASAALIARRVPAPEIVEVAGAPAGGEPGASLLPKVEITEQSMRAEKMTEGIKGLVMQTPDIASGLIRRWLAEET